MPAPSIRTEQTFTAHGQGRLTLTALGEVLSAAADLPNDAVVTVKHHDDQRDGASWAITITIRKAAR